MYRRVFRFCRILQYTQRALDVDFSPEYIALRPVSSKRMVAHCGDVLNILLYRPTLPILMNALTLKKLKADLERGPNYNK